MEPRVTQISFTINTELLTELNLMTLQYRDVYIYREIQYPATSIPTFNLTQNKGKKKPPDERMA
jgi:hypothetical protein